MNIHTRLKNQLTSLWQPILQYQQASLPRFPDFLVLARLNRPIGIYLLLWPALWGLWIAAEGWPGIHLFLVFCLGVVLMRSAGCVFNDLADREFDGHVKRTRSRPIATQVIKPIEAVIYCVVLGLFAFGLVLTTNTLTILLSFGAVFVALCYPFMKRYTYMPQVILGVAFAWSIPMAFAAVTNTVTTVAWMLFTATVVWTVAYDTEYAMVDRDDDIKLGLKSTAILFGELDRLMVGILQVLFIAILIMLDRRLSLGIYYYLGIAVACGMLIYQQYLIRERNRDDCFDAFLNNHWAGAAIFVGILLGYL
jgi:4-hydroxybenzoate polyprenyltransferase